VSKKVIDLLASISASQHFSFSFSLAARCAVDHHLSIGIRGRVAGFAASNGRT